MLTSLLTKIRKRTKELRKGTQSIPQTPDYIEAKRTLNLPDGKSSQKEIFACLYRILGK